MTRCPVACRGSHVFSQRERIARLKREREREGEKGERYRGARMVTRGSPWTGCNSQIYYFSPWLRVILCQRQTGECSAASHDENEYFSCFVAFLPPAGYISGSLIRTDFTGRLCMRPSTATPTKKTTSARDTARHDAHDSNKPRRFHSRIERISALPF